MALAGCIALTLLPESIRALTSLPSSLSFFRQNCTRYQMHGTHSRVASLLVLVIEAEIAKTNTSFLIHSFLAQSSLSSSAFSCYS